MSIYSNFFRSSTRWGLHAASKLIPWARHAPRSLMYHSVDDSGSLISVSPQRLREHLSLLRTEQWSSLSASEFVDIEAAGKSAPKKVFITFDDGYVNFLTNAMPLLKEFGFTATVFVATDLVGKNIEAFRRDRKFIHGLAGAQAAGHDHVNDSLEAASDLPLMSWEQILEAARCDFDIQSHSAAHRVLTTLGAEELAADLARSRKQIERRLGRLVDIICYPYGARNPAVVAAARVAGYRLGVTADRFGPPGDLLQLSRIGINDLITSGDLAYLLSDAAECEAAFRQRFHRNGSAPS